MEKTINQLKFELQEIAEKHKRIESFFFGEFNDALNLEQPLIYPAMVCQLLPGSMTKKAINISVAIAIIDKVTEEDFEQHTEVFSDTLQISADIKNIFSSYRFEDLTAEDNSITFEPIKDRSGDLVSGILFNITLNSFDYQDWCAIPIENYDFENSPFIDCETGSLPIPSDCPSGSVENSDDSFSASVPSGSLVVLPDIDVTINGDAFETIPSVKNTDIIVKNESGHAVGSKVGNEWIVPDGGVSGIAYNYPTPPKTYASYLTGDAAWRFANGDFNYPNQDGKIARLVDFFTLAENNVHGNTNRFTDVDGGQDYVLADNNKNMIKDHYTGLMWCVPNLGWRFWSSALTNANNAGNGGFTNWTIPVFNELSTLVYRGDGTGLNYSPFNILANWLNDSVEIRNNIWTCETPENNTGQYKGVFYNNGAVISAAGDFFFSRALDTDTFRSLYVRRF